MTTPDENQELRRKFMNRSFIVSLTWFAIMAIPFSISFGIEADLGTESQREVGKKLYLNSCAHCHGTEGEGNGFAQKTLKPWPRNFTKGIYKFKSTTGDRLPTTKDIERVIRNGNPYTGMPSWPGFTDEEVSGLAYYLKTFSEDFSDPESLADEEIAPIPMKPPSSIPSWSKESAEKGKIAFKEQKCVDCHGDFGRGSGSSAPTVEDMDGNHLAPRDLTKRWTFRNGNTREDIFRTITTGVNPMPAFDKLTEEERWNLVDYVLSFGNRNEPRFGTVVTAIGMQENLDLIKGEDLFAKATSAYFPMLGQITQPGRAFFASSNGVEVKAVFNQEEIAFLLVWHDMSAQRNGMNSPTLEVPKFDPHQLSQATVPQEEGFGDEEEGNESDSPKSKFSDAVAIQIPSSKSEGHQKPYFIFGDSSLSVDLWFVDLATNSPKVYQAKGSKNIQETEEVVDFVSSYQDGRWSAIFKRKRIKEGQTSFLEKKMTPIAFSIWDGFNEERGNKRALSQWFHIYLNPLVKESVLLKMAIYAMFIVIIQLSLVYYVRKKFGAKNQDKGEN